MKKVTQPTLIMWGEKDRWIPKRHVPMYCKAIKNSKSIIYPGLGHMPMEEMPDITAQDAREFLLKK
jgi:pimeloyl-ACP methyl ester carboxylesterase